MKKLFKLRQNLLVALLMWVSVSVSISANGYAQESGLVAGIPLEDMHVPFAGDLTQMMERRVIRALVPRSRTDFFIHNGKPAGAMADLLHEYEKFLNAGRSKSDIEIKVAFVPVRFDQLIPSLIKGKGDLIAAMMTVTIPALPRIMSQMMILRRVGWLMTRSASFVVKPVPEKAESAWKTARWWSMPVMRSAIAAVRTTRKDTKIARRVGRRK